jgi:hypothetical protein
MSASNSVLTAYTQDEIVLNDDQQRLIGLMSRMRLFAPPRVVSGAEAVLRAIVEISLQLGVELRQLAKEALSKSLDPDPLSGIQPGLPGRLGQRAPISDAGNVAAPTRAAPVPALNSGGTANADAAANVTPSRL